MPCPHLKEVVMLYCDACPVKKMLPLDRLVSASPCLAPGYDACRVFLEAELGDPADSPRRERPRREALS